MSVSGKKLAKKIPLPLSSSLPSLMESDSRVYCQPCDEDGQKVPAHGYCTECKEHLCHACFVFHKKHKLSKHHTLLDAEHMPKSLQKPPVSTRKSQYGDLTTPCVKHPNERVKFYCNDHAVLLCSVCVTLGHQSKLCNVNYIPDISGNMIDSKKYREILKAVNITIDQFQMMTEDVRKVTKKCNISLKNIITDIKHFRQEINERLDVLEKQSIDVVNAIEQENRNNLKKVEAVCEDITKSLITSSNNIKQFNTSVQADKLFLELKYAENLMDDVFKKGLLMPSHDIKVLTFQHHVEILTLLRAIQRFGTLTEKSMQAHQDPICLTTNTECHITGMTLINPDLLILTDSDNDSIKIVDTKTNSVSDESKVDGGPWDVTTMTFSKLAVTLHRNHQVQILSMASKKLSKLRHFEVDGECRGINFHQSKFVISFCNPAKLQILDKYGAVERNIGGKNIIENPWYVKTNSDFIYVSDWGSRTIVRFNWQGEVVGIHRGMVAPKGMALSDDGTFFVCDWVKNIIGQISRDSSKRNVLFETRIRPNTVCWCPETRRLFYTCHSDVKILDNLLHIYKIET